MRNKKEILERIKNYNKNGFEGKDILYFMEDELCDTCPMELFSCKCPKWCHEDADCYDCIEKHIDLFLADKLENK